MRQDGDRLAVPRWDQLSWAARPRPTARSGLGFLQTPGAGPQELGWALPLVPPGRERWQFPVFRGSGETADSKISPE